MHLLPNDFELQTQYKQGVDWPGGKQFYQALVPYYEQATNEIGVAGDKEAMDQLYRGFNVSPDGVYGPNYDYPMPGIVSSLVDQQYEQAVSDMVYDNIQLSVTPTLRGAIHYRVNAVNVRGIRIVFLFALSKPNTMPL